MNKPIVNVRLADEEMEALEVGGPQFGPQLAKLLDEEMSRFERWMQDSLKGGLSRWEKAIVKTYLYHKIVGRVDILEHAPIKTEEDTFSTAAEVPALTHLLK